MDFKKEVENLGLKLNGEHEQKFETYFMIKRQWEEKILDQLQLAKNM